MAIFLNIHPVAPQTFPNPSANRITSSAEAVGNPMITIQAQNVETEELTALVRLSLPALSQAFGDLGIPHPIPAAILISQWYFRVFLAGQGVRLNNGKVYIYDGYKEWAAQFPPLSQWQFGRIVRALRSQGLVETGCFAHLKSLFPAKNANPVWHLCHEDNKRTFLPKKWV